MFNNRGSLFILAVLGTVASAAALEVSVDAVMMTEPNGRELTAYAADARRLYAIFKTKGAKSGDKIRGVWIADDVGTAASPGYKIEEKTITAEGDIANGEFSLSKPDAWPLGKYHIDIYVNDELATTVKFEIKSGGKSKKEDEAKEEEESGD